MDLVIFAGPNGSGKSSIIGQFIKEYHWEDYEYVNPDEYAKRITEDISIKEKYMRAFELAEQKYNSLVENNKSFIIETVNSTDKKFPLYQKCSQIGYKIIVIFVGTSSSDINIKRVAIRKSQGGHDVPIDKIVSRYKKSMENLQKLALFADQLFVFDNSVDGGSPKLLFQKIDNEIDIVEKTQWLCDYLINPLNKKDY